MSDFPFDPDGDRRPPSKVVIYALMTVILVATAGGVYFVYFHYIDSHQNTNLDGSISDISKYPSSVPILQITLNNPSKLLDPYNVTITLDLPNGQSVALGYIDLIEWGYHDFSIQMNVQQNSTTDFVISTGTDMILTNLANSNYNFAGTQVILTYTGLSGAITFTIP